MTPAARTRAPRRACAAASGFTLLEGLVVVALVAVVLTLAVPSFYDFILVQRLKGTAAQLVTDLNLARSEAVARSRRARLFFIHDGSMSCYSVYTLVEGTSAGTRCDCTRGPGNACTSPNAREVRTVQVPASLGLRLLTAAQTDTSIAGACSGSGSAGFDPAFAYDERTGAIRTEPIDTASVPLGEFVVCATIASDPAAAPRALRIAVSAAGRPSMCQTRPGLGSSPC